jgi:DNA modification methylase
MENSQINTGSIEGTNVIGANKVEQPSIALEIAQKYIKKLEEEVAQLKQENENLKGVMKKEVKKIHPSFLGK